MSILDLYCVEAHVCVSCLGRVLSRALPDLDGVAATSRLYRCADCGVEKEGSTSAVICACGFRVSGRATIGLRCEPNPDKSAEFPAEIVAKQV
jgi:hypothetical protein